MGKMLDQPTIRVAVCLLIATFITSNLLVSVSARYLPTRSQESNLEKLREVLKELLGENVDRRPSSMDYGDLVNSGRSAGIYKRSANAYSPPLDAFEPAAAEDFRSGFVRTSDLRKSMQ